jgi:hypothetical protein
MDLNVSRWRVRRWLASVAAVVAMSSAAWSAEADGAAASPAPAGPWPAPVAGFISVDSGEHPRLFFRKTDVAVLRERAGTAEGKAIVARCRKLLGLDPNPAVPYTLWDAAAAGFLYQVTGNKFYAELGRQGVQKALDGAKDKDARYSFISPSEPLRAGPALAAVAMAYDLCYDGWEPAYRKKVCQAIMNYDQPTKGGRASLEQLSLRPLNPNPASSHLAFQAGGAGLAILAIQGDEGADDLKLAEYRKGVDKTARKVLTEDFGEAGYFGEHVGPGMVAGTWTFVPWLQAQRVCAGRDWIGPRPNAEWITLRFVFQTINNGKAPYFMNWDWSDGTEGGGSDVVEQGGGHHGGVWCQGFGAIRPEHAAAMLWVYRHFVEPTERARYKDLAAGEKSYDASSYPHRAMFAFLNWPFGVTPVNPAEVLGKVSQDPTMGQYIFRNRWQDAEDIEVAVLFGGRAKAAGADLKGRRIMIRAFGGRMSFGKLIGQEHVATTCTAGGDGSGVASGGGNSVAVDFSKASGSDALVIVCGPAGTGILAGDVDKTRAKVFSVEAAGGKFSILSLSKSGTHREPAEDGERIVLGGQTVRLVDGKIVLGKFAETGH